VGLRLRWRSLEDLSSAEIEAWSRLGREACSSPNPFAMPEFVLPARRHLLGDLELRIAWFEDAASTLLGVGVFSARKASWFVPMPHLRDLRTPFSFRSGLLIARGAAQAVAQALVSQAEVAAIDLRNLPAGDVFGVALRQASADHGGGWHLRHSFERPVWRIGEDRHALPWPKDLQRRRRKAEVDGGLQSELCIPGAGDASYLHDVECVDQLYGRPASVELATPTDACLETLLHTHLRLEHAGWKGDAGSSLQSTPTHADFFSEMIHGFAEIGAAVFMQTQLAGKVIASSSNLLLGDTLNAFKIGWDPEHAQYSPGRINELVLCEAASKKWLALRCFDSQTQAGGYLANLLPDRRTMLSGTVALNASAQRKMRMARAWRPVAYRLSDPDL
jgi:hypothetical protein